MKGLISATRGQIPNLWVSSCPSVPPNAGMHLQQRAGWATAGKAKELCASSANSPTTLSRVPGGMENKHSAGGSSTRWLWDKEVPRGSGTHPPAQLVAAEGSPASEQNLFIYLLIIY